MPHASNPYADFLIEQQEYCHAVVGLAALKGSREIYGSLIKANKSRGVPPVVRDELNGLRDYGDGRWRLAAPDFIGDTRASLLDFLCETADILKYRMQPFEQLGLDRTDHSAFADFPHSLDESRRYLALCAHKVRQATHRDCRLLAAGELATEVNREVRFDTRRALPDPVRPQHAPEVFQPRRRLDH